MQGKELNETPTPLQSQIVLQSSREATAGRPVKEKLEVESNISFRGNLQSLRRDDVSRVISKAP